MVENLAQPSSDGIVELKNLKSSTQVALAHGCHSLMSLPHLLAQRTIGRVPQVDYSQDHVVVTLALGLQPRQGLARVRAKREARESYLMLPGVQKSVEVQSVRE
jgi:hypothetical protein